ncbi:helicase-related protein [Clostridium sp. MSTE9]|uniref:helicase-related protein n=1 Tax=Clostridium sp. (strain MSTE9) TaxID=1105031 RepID=UPI00055803A6|nr:helicase-related protein [Clostridium sp. MSTE9]
MNKIPDGEKAIVFANNKERLKNLNEKYSTCSYFVDSETKFSNKSTRELSTPVQQIVKNEKFDKKFLFCTKVLDNGVNIKDTSLKHIFIEMDDLIEFVQCLGRKRICDENDKITLYFYNYTAHIEQSKYQDQKKDYEVYLDHGNFSRKDFADKYNRAKSLPYFLENGYEIIRPALVHFLDRFNFLKEIASKEIYFWDEIRKMLKMPKKKIVKIHAATPNEVLKEYLSDRKGKRLFSQEKEELVKIFNIRKDDRLINDLEQLNTYLSVNSIPFHIVSGRESADNGNRDMRYWLIE